jgi:predicted DNA-binding transcriptional regulator AlpA
MAPLLNLSELAAVLGRSAETIKRDIRRNPAAVPPRLDLPGTRLLRWRESDVQTWLDRYAVAAPCADKVAT